MKISVTQLGIYVAIIVPVLVQFGFSEACSNEIVNVLSPLPGLALAWFGRWRQGDVNLLGIKK